MNKLRIPTLSLLLTLSLLTFAQKTKTLQTQYTPEVLEAVIAPPGSFKPVPNASSNFWKETLNYWTRNSYANNGKGYLGKPWIPIPLAIFQEYSTNGNRSHYEERHFNQRRQMACLVMAEIAQDSGVFLNDIIKGLHYFAKETWWGVPAHYPKSAPDPKLQEVDLFNAETANLLAWTCYMLEDRIKPIDKNICNTIRKEIVRRILIPARATDYHWKHIPQNHNTWTCANWLSCVLFCETNRKRQIDDIYQILTCLDAFIDGYPEDGGCDEGPYYWDRAAGSLFECFQLLALASDGKITMPMTKKIQSIANYLCDMYIGKGNYVCFADTYAKMLPNVNIMYPFGYAIGNKRLMGHAAYIAKQNDYIWHPWTLFNRSGLYPSLSRELCFLRLMPIFSKEEAKEAITPYTWHPNTEVFTARTTSGLYVAGKGGNNNESHNHNDIGNFIVYTHGDPVLIDLGMGNYDAKTFSSERYTQPNNRSSFHNVPFINGCEQKEGAQYKASNVTFGQSNEYVSFSLDIAKAYPPEARVKEWIRTIEYDQPHELLRVNEVYHLTSYQAPTSIILLTPIYPEIIEERGELIFKSEDGTTILQYPKDDCHITVETVDLSHTTMQQTWQKEVYRILMTIKGKKLKGKLAYTISTS